MVLQGAPDAAEVNQAAAAFGLQLKLESLPAPPALWAELQPAVAIFAAMRTQWRTGPAGAIGLDYSVLPVVEQRLRMTRRQSREAFGHLQVMESEALRWLDEQRARQ